MLRSLLAMFPYKCLSCNVLHPDILTNDTLRSIAGREAGLEDPDDFGLEDFTYENRIIAEMIFKHMEETNFVGLTVCYIDLQYVIYFYVITLAFKVRWQCMMVVSLNWSLWKVNVLQQLSPFCALLLLL